MPIRYTFKLVLVFSFLFCSNLFATNQKNLNNQNTNQLRDQSDGQQDLDQVNFKNWQAVQKNINQIQQKDEEDGIGYLISGLAALAGGIAGEKATLDPLEKGTYTFFQSIGIASMGYGAFRWKVGDENRHFYNVINTNPDLSNEQKLSLYKNYLKLNAEREKQINKIKAYTHAMIAALNFYSASNQENSAVKNSLYFLGTVNLIATISYTF